MSRWLLPSWLALLFFLGCHVTDGKAPAPRTVPAEARGAVEVEATPTPVSKPSPNDLAAAAIFLEKGDQVSACFHLGRFVQAHPEHANARCYFAELLTKLGKRTEARAEFERAAADAQQCKPVDVHHQI